MGLFLWSFALMIPLEHGKRFSKTRRGSESDGRIEKECKKVS